MTKDELIERLAAIEHDRWGDWQKYLHSKCVPGTEPYTDERDGSICIEAGYLQALERQIATPYADLSESEKQSDREQVMRYWPVLVAFVAEWLDANEVLVPDEIDGRLSSAVDAWREEMGS